MSNYTEKDLQRDIDLMEGAYEAEAFRVYPYPDDPDPDPDDDTNPNGDYDDENCPF